jgi:hypothetical protein
VLMVSILNRVALLAVTIRITWPHILHCTMAVPRYLLLLVRLGRLQYGIGEPRLSSKFNIANSV